MWTPASPHPTPVSLDACVALLSHASLDVQLLVFYICLCSSASYIQQYHPSLGGLRLPFLNSERDSIIAHTPPPLPFLLSHLCTFTHDAFLTYTLDTTHTYNTGTTTRPHCQYYQDSSRGQHQTITLSIYLSLTARSSQGISSSTPPHHTTREPTMPSSSFLQGLQDFAAEAHQVVPWRDFFSLSLPFALFLLAWYAGFCWYFIHIRRDKLPLSQKRKAWFCSFFISCMSTPFGIIYALRILSPKWDPEEMLDADATSRVLLTLFLTYLVVDMGLGLFQYKDEFGVLSGWIHHLFYTGFLFHAYVKGYCISFGYTLLMEASSIFLSGGRLFPWLRSDMAFGGLFFATRIVYHAFLLWKLATIPNPRVVMWYPVLGVWFLHIFWGHGWVKQQVCVCMYVFMYACLVFISTRLIFIYLLIAKTLSMYAQMRKHRKMQAGERPETPLSSVPSSSTAALGAAAYVDGESEKKISSRTSNNGNGHHHQEQEVENGGKAKSKKNKKKLF